MERNPYLKVKAFLVENRIKQKDVAKELNMSVPTINKKLNGTGADFTIIEARKFCLKFKADPKIFFT